MATVTVCDVGNRVPFIVMSYVTQGSCRESPDFLISDAAVNIGVVCSQHLPFATNHLLTTSHDGGHIQVSLYDGKDPSR